MLEMIEMQLPPMHPNLLPAVPGSDLPTLSAADLPFAPSGEILEDSASAISDEINLDGVDGVIPAKKAGLQEPLATLYDDRSLEEIPDDFYFPDFSEFYDMYYTNFDFRSQFDQFLIGNDLQDFRDWVQRQSRSWGGEFYDRIISGQYYDIGDYIIVHVGGNVGYLFSIQHGGILQDTFTLEREIIIERIQAGQTGSFSVTIGTDGLGVTAGTESGVTITYRPR